MIWLSAVGCRRELQKMGDLAKKAKHCQKIFEPFVGKKQAEQIYRDLCDDSRSYPIKTIDLPGCSLEGSLFDKGNIPTSPVQRSAVLDRGTFFGDCPSRWFLRIFQIMDEKAYFEFLAVTQNEGPLHFLIEVTGKKSEDPKLRAEDFIYLQHLAGIQRTEGPKNISEEEAEKLYKVEQIATYGDGKVWTVFKNLD